MKSSRTQEIGMRPRCITAVLLALTLLAGASDAIAQIQTNRPKPTGPPLLENRFLFIVETSKHMAKRQEGVLEAMGDLLGSSMKGQLHKGDTLGVWTFNEKLVVGKFPLERWPAQGQEKVAGRVMRFVQQQVYEKSPDLGSVTSTLQKVIRDSDFITVILLTTGEDKISGTTYDDAINQAYEGWRAEQKSAKKPIVTILRATHGKITDWRVTPAQWAVEMPALPAELRPAIASAKPAAQPGATASTSTPAKPPTPPPAPSSPTTTTSTTAPSGAAPGSKPPGSDTPKGWLVGQDPVDQVGGPALTQQFPSSTTAPATLAAGLPPATAQPKITNVLAAPPASTNDSKSAPATAGPGTPATLTQPAKGTDQSSKATPANPESATTNAVATTDSERDASTSANAPHGVGDDAAQPAHALTVAFKKWSTNFRIELAAVALVAFCAGLGLGSLRRKRQPSRLSLITRSMREDQQSGSGTSFRSRI